MLVKEHKNKKISSALDMSIILKAILKFEDEIDQQKEHFWAIGLTTANRIKYIDLVSLGSLNTSVVHPRETFRNAVAHGVASIIIAHNHPSNNLAVSNEDKAITTQLKEAGKIIGIEVLDHIIISNDNNDYLSFADSNLLPTF